MFPITFDLEKTLIPAFHTEAVAGSSEGHVEEGYGVAMACMLQNILWRRGVGAKQSVKCRKVMR